MRSSSTSFMFVRSHSPLHTYLTATYPDPDLDAATTSIAPSIHRAGTIRQSDMAVQNPVLRREVINIYKGT